MTDRYTTKYINDTKSKPHNIFSEEYFSGSDVNVYIDGQLIETVGVGFSLQEQQRPIYGYGSTTFDEVSTGNRIVVGTLKVPLKNPLPNDIITNNKDYYNPNGEQEEPSTTKSSTPSWTANNKVINYSSNISSSNGNNGSSSQSSNSVNIKSIQTKLIALGYNVDLTGILDLKTKQALSEYQKKNMINITGNLDIDTLKSLNTLSDDNKARIITKTYLMTGPGDEYNHYIDLEVGEYVVIEQKFNDLWYLIVLDNGKKGYIKKSNLSSGV